MIPGGQDGYLNSPTVTDELFATRLQNVFVIGTGTTPIVTLPKGRGIKKTILEERAEAEAAGRI